MINRFLPMLSTALVFQKQVRIYDLPNHKISAFYFSQRRPGAKYSTAACAVQVFAELSSL